MPALRFASGYSVYIPIVIIASLLPGGCSLGDILTGVKTDYTVTANETDPKTSNYLQKILDERIAEKVKAFSDDDDPELQSRQESYAEQTIRADLLKAAQAKGYYNARVVFDDAQAPLTGTYRVEYGPQFKINQVGITPDSYEIHLDATLLAAGNVLDAEKVLAAQSVLYRGIQKDRCYFSLSVKNEVELSRARNSGDVIFLVDAGREGNFGPVNFAGNDSVRESYLRKLLSWREGDCFRREKIEDYKAKLLQSGLFSRADVILPDAPDDDGTVPITLDLHERAHRTVSAGATYYSDEGPGVVLGWEHRNILGAAEKLTADLNLSSLKQSVDFNFSKPFFIRKDQNLLLNASLRRQDTDAYEELGIDFGAGLSRNFTRYLSGRTGVDLSVTRIDDHSDNNTRTFGLVSLPQSLTYDNRDDKLDPHRGWNLSATAEPFFDVLGESSPFFKTQFTGSGYWAIGTPADLVLASKVGVGSLWGADVDDIPATERFYAGGGGSVRGFGYQEVGPRDADDDPSGGRSLVNFSVELRSKFTDTIGAVAFVDGASVSEKSSPTFENMAIGAGVGARYYTGFGPIRFDIAVPLTEKDELDQNFQFYISIGQAF